MQYIAPGLIMMSVITNSYGNVVSSFFGAKFGKHIEELLVSPLPNWIIVLGYVCGGLMRGMHGRRRRHRSSSLLLHATCTCTTSVVIVAAVLLTSVVFSLGGFINAMFAKNFDQVNWIPTFVLTPLTYFGGVFYSVTLLPEWAQKHVATRTRSCTWSTRSVTAFSAPRDVNVVVAFAIMIVCVAVLFTVAVMLLNRGTGTRD